MEIFFFFDFSFVRCLLWWTNTATGSLTIKHRGRWYSSEIRPASRTWTRWLRWCVTMTTRMIHYPAASSAVLHIPPKTPFLLVTTWIQPMGRIRSPHSVTAHTVAPTVKSRPCPWWSHWISSQSVGPLSIRFHPSAGVSPIFMIALTSVSPMFGILNPSALNGFTKTKTFPFLLSTFSSQLFFSCFLSFFLSSLKISLNSLIYSFATNQVLLHGIDAGVCHGDVVGGRGLFRYDDDLRPRLGIFGRWHRDANQQTSDDAEKYGLAHRCRRRSGMDETANCWWQTCM